MQILRNLDFSGNESSPDGAKEYLCKVQFMQKVYMLSLTAMHIFQCFTADYFLINELFFNRGKHKYQNKNTEVLLDPSKDTGVEVSADNTRSC
jgi:hypothetical protein